MVQSKPTQLSWRLLVMSLALLITTTFNTAISYHTTATTFCDDIRFVFARGSGEKLGDVSYSAWRSNLRTELLGTSLRYSFYELGTEPQAGHQYPAVTVSKGVGGIANLLGAAVSGGAAFAFGESVAEGQAELKAYLEQVSRTCPQTRFVLGGYSQGAMLISMLLPELDANKILYIATFGDPKLYLPEGESKGTPRHKLPPEACRGANLSPYRIYVPDCYAYEGVLGSIQPYQPTAYQGKIGTWCNKSDIMCSSGLSIQDHTSYISEQLYYDAALKVRQTIIANYPHDTLASADIVASPHDLVFLFDTTGSMQDFINQYRDEAKKLATRVYEQGGRVALFEYRDLQENFDPRLLCDFSCDQATLFSQLDQLRAYGGKDRDESLLSAVLVAMNTLKWNNGATKTAVILTDAPYHRPDHDGTTEDMVIQRSLAIDPVNLYVIAPVKRHSFYQYLTTATGGRVLDSAAELEVSTEIILRRPVAKLAMPTYSGVVNEQFTFDASASFSVNGAELAFDWDLDGDGIYELENGDSTIKHTYHDPFMGFIQVRVRDGEMSSTMSAYIDVQSEQPRLAEIADLATTPVANHAAQITFSTNAEQVLLILDGAVVGLKAVHSGYNAITITDVTQSTTLTLVPYLDQHKGVPSSIEIVGGDFQASTTTPPVPLPLPQPEPDSVAPNLTPTAPTTGTHF